LMATYGGQFTLTNVLQKRTQSTVRRISSALRKRLEHLSSDFWAFAFLC
ncbi:TPA: DUF1819 family protein, partial [Escherichia coli]|nr:DUF1819 family protein [Escherichia coli]HEL3356267.1 DUF1819 family protein [Escherichia coli]